MPPSSTSNELPRSMASSGYYCFLRAATTLSFVWGIFALTWYASKLYYDWPRPEPKPPSLAPAIVDTSSSANHTDGLPSLVHPVAISPTPRAVRNDSHALSGGVSEEETPIRIETQTNHADGHHHQLPLSDGPPRRTETIEGKPRFHWRDPSTLVYATGSGCWIVTSALIYLTPLLLWIANRGREGIGRLFACGNQRSQNENGSNGTGIMDGDGDGYTANENVSTSRELETTDETVASYSTTVPNRFRFSFPPLGCISRRRSLPTVIPWRIVVLCMVWLPSLWVFLYGTYTAVPRARQQLSAKGENLSPRFTWFGALVLASACPAGTAGMVSMGVYVFGTVAKHSPLWSAEIVLPSGKGAIPNQHHSHANLMRDALRLHQWAGYLSFFWLMLHSIVYCLIYGFYGVVGVKAAALASSTTDHEGITASFVATTITTRETVVIFLSSVWKALIPPPECRPILGGNGSAAVSGNETQDHSSEKSHHEILRLLAEANHHHHQNGSSTPRSSCYGYYRNFNGFLATISFSLLVITSLAMVRRKNYRFFYASHILSASVFMITMIFHMRRIVVYMTPSLLFYCSTTIPTVIQAWICAVRDGGVRIDDFRVLEGVSSHTSSLETNDRSSKHSGCAELTFSVDMASLKTRACISDELRGRAKITHRPKSVKICVPSISLLWYPFTVIETGRRHDESRSSDPSEGEEDDNGGDGDPMQYTILFGTVGYFTKTLWKRLKDAEDLSKAANANEAIDEFLDESSNEHGIVVRNQQTEVTQGRLPLLLVDGFYSGASDWIESALNHDAIVIAAGGTGVTPFLSFVPKLIRLLRREEGSVGMAEQDDSGAIEAGVPVSEYSRQSSLKLRTVSFVWCCRDEALIRHVLTTYLLPLLEMAEESALSESDGVVRSGRDRSNPSGVFVQLLIYNTSRDRSDPPQHFDLCEKDPRSDFVSTRRRSELTSISQKRGFPMRPSKIQYSRSSSPRSLLVGSTGVLSIAVVGMALHYRAMDRILRERGSFSVRAYGVYSILAWSVLVGFVTDMVWRCCASCSLTPRYGAMGYVVAEEHENNLSVFRNGNEEGDDDDDDDDDGDEEEEVITAGGSGMECNETNTRQDLSNSPGSRDVGIHSCLPGRVYRRELVPGTDSILEWGVRNGRPVFKGEREREREREGEVEVEGEDAVAVAGPSVLQRVIEADRPGVFYCGPDGLLETIKSRVHAGRREAQTHRFGNGGNDGLQLHARDKDCVFYEESYEI